MAEGSGVSSLARPTTVPGRQVGRLVAVGVAVVLLLCLVLAVAVAALGVRVDGHSMQPTLRDGERLLAVPGSGGEVHRFDVVLLRTPGRDAVIVKRVVGLPGDRVEIVSTPQDPFAVLVQPGGTGPWYRAESDTWPAQSHRSTNCCTSDGTRANQAAAQTVPPGRIFFLGDNPDGSDDSRAYGWGDLATVSGRVGLRVWPLSGLGAIGGRPTLREVPTPSS